MLKNYLKIALRNFRRHKTLSAINILGLATGIACCLLIALYVFHETSYDRFHEKSNRTVRVTMEYSFDGVVSKTSMTGNKVFPAFKRNFPEVENGVRMYNLGTIVKYNDKLFEEKAFVYADSTVFDVFSFKLLQGNPAKVLEAPNTVVLTESVARKYFGDDNAVGKVIRINNKQDYAVTGVAEDCPANSHIKFDFLASFSSLDARISKTERWWNANYYTYLVLKDPGAITSLASRIPAYMRTQDKENGIAGNNYLTYHLEPLDKVHLYSQVEGGFEPAGDYRYVYIFSIVALLILVIACANYMNLVTARASERAREIGVRKVMGAERKQLFGQFLGESGFTVFIALLLGLGLVRLMLPAFNALTAKELEFMTLLKPPVVLIVPGILLVVGLLGGSYPALILSGFIPVKVLKGDFKTSTAGVWLRKSLIVVQFVISVGLIICTIIINYQLQFIQNRKLGYNKDHVLVLPVDDFIREKASTFKTEFKSNPSVAGVSICTQTPTFIPGRYGIALDGREMTVTAEGVDKDFIQTLGLEVISGSGFTEADETEIRSENKTVPDPLMLNETVVASLGWKPAEAVGKTIEFEGKKHRIKGVVKNFHFDSMKEPIGPMVLFLTGYNRIMLVKLSGKQLPQTLEFLESKWNVLAAHRPFQYKFLDEEFDKLYVSESRTGRIFFAFALLAIGLACLGLFGLATFAAQQRTREIGIRKVLGASLAGIVKLLSKDFLKLVLIALVIAAPVAWYFMHEWLSDFAYRISIGWWVFVVSGVLAILIALITISFQAIKAAIANPVKSLRTE